MSACKTCLHPEIQIIDAALLAGESQRKIAARFGLSKDGVRRHVDRDLVQVPTPGKESPHGPTVPDVGETSALDEMRALVKSLKETPTEGLSPLSKWRLPERSDWQSWNWQRSRLLHRPTEGSTGLKVRSGRSSRASSKTGCVNRMPACRVHSARQSRSTSLKRVSEGHREEGIVQRLASADDETAQGDREAGTAGAYEGTRQVLPGDAMKKAARTLADPGGFGAGIRARLGEGLGRLPGPR
jgi:hypothetical protein